MRKLTLIDPVPSNFSPRIYAFRVRFRRSGNVKGSDLAVAIPQEAGLQKAESKVFVVIADNLPRWGHPGRYGGGRIRGVKRGENALAIPQKAANRSSLCISVIADYLTRWRNGCWTGGDS